MGPLAIGVTSGTLLTISSPASASFAGGPRCSGLGPFALLVLRVSRQLIHGDVHCFHEMVDGRLAPPGGLARKRAVDVLLIPKNFDDLLDCREFVGGAAVGGQPPPQRP